MSARIMLSIGVALSALAMSTGVSQAALSPDVTEVSLGTGAVAAGLMVFLLLVYLVRRALGLVKPPPDDLPAPPH